MNKIQALMAGVGIGGALAYLLYPAKKKPRAEPARHKTAHLASGAEGVPDVSARGFRGQSCLIGDGAASRRATTHGGTIEAVVNDTFAKPGRAGLVAEVAPPLAEVALSMCVADLERRAGSPKPADNILAKRLLKGFFKVGGLAYRIINRVAFPVCLCAAGLRILVRISDKRTVRGSGGARRKSLSKRERGLIIGFTSLAFLIRLLIPRPQQGLNPDGVYYATLGRHLVAGNLKEGLSTFWPPLYPLLVGLSSLIFRDVVAGGKFISAAAGGVLVVPVYLLARALYGPEAASVGAFLIAIHPTLLNYSTLLLTESTYTLLFALGLFAGLTALAGGGFMAFFLTGVALGACYLTRPEAIGYMGLMLALTLCTQLAGSELPLSEASFHVLGLILGFSLVSFPYLLFLRRATGRWTISDKLRPHIHSTASWERKWFGLPEGRQTTLADRLYAGLYREDDLLGEREPMLVDRQSFQRMAGRRLEALRLEIHPALSRVIGPHLMVLIGFGLFQTEWLKDIYLLLFLSSTLVGYALCPDEISDRLLVPLVPLLLCWAAKGVVEVERGLGRLLTQMRIFKALSFNNPALIRTLILTATLFSALHSLANTLTQVPPNHLLEYRLAGEWVRGRSEMSPLIMAVHPYTAFYAGGKPLYLPVEEYATVVAHAKRQQVDYLVIDEAVVSKGIWGNNEYSNLRFLLDEQRSHPGLELVYKFARIPHRKLLIFTLT